MSDIASIWCPPRPVSDETKRFGAYLRRCRVDAGLTLGDMSRRLKVRVVSYCEIERGVRDGFMRKHWDAISAWMPTFSAAQAERIIGGEEALPVRKTQRIDIDIDIWNGEDE